MQKLWFIIGWWGTFLILFPICSGVSYSISILQIAGKISFDITLNYAVPINSFLNMFTDLFILILPIQQTLALQMSRKQRVQILGIFALGPL